MPYNVVVSFGQNSEFEFKVSDAQVSALSRDDASQWLHAEYEALECAPRNPVGKILLLDTILDVAKYGGEARFAAGGEWALRFAACCAAALRRDTRVDVLNLVVG
ncbi:MAG: hypothetical protein ACM3Y9_11545 [Ignavibacteria bacterium]